MEVQILNRALGMKEFVVESEQEISEDAASEIQMQKGFHPAGYGFYGFRSQKLESGIYFTSWHCGGHCD